MDVISSSLSEKELINLLKNDSENAFDLIFRKYYKILCAYAEHYTKDINVAEEIVQDIFVKIWEMRDRLEIKSSLKSYLFKSVYYSYIHFSKQIRSQITLTETNNFQDAQDTDYLVELELEQKIHNTIEALPNQCKKIFKMSRFENLKYKEIAEKLNITVKAVEAQISKALKVLSENLIEYIPLLILYGIINF